jgi:hypothetical protein
MKDNKQDLSLSLSLSPTTSKWCPAFFGFKGGHDVVVCVRSRAPACKCIPRLLVRRLRALCTTPNRFRPLFRKATRRNDVLRVYASCKATGPDIKKTSPSLRGACPQVSGKRGRISVNSVRRARAMRPDHDDYLQLASPIPNLASRNLAQP